MQGQDSRWRNSYQGAVRGRRKASAGDVKDDAMSQKLMAEGEVTSTLKLQMQELVIATAPDV